MVEVARDAPGRQPSRNACPQCGVPVFRDHRRSVDRLVGLFREVRRYQCKACGWQGLLVQSATLPSAATRRPRSLNGWIVVGVLLTSLVALAAGVYWISERANPMLLSTTPSQSLAGATPERTDAGTEAIGRVGEVRSDCVWAGPGDAPFPGKLAAALTAARLPSEIIDKIGVMHAGHLVTDRLSISNVGIRSADGRRNFGHSTKAMVLGNTICFGVRVNMPPDTITFADLYELVDEENRRYMIMVVARGGNVAVLEELTKD